jgi:hypothetical protein
MYLSSKEWATLDECIHALASMPGALSAQSIEQGLVAAIRSGRLPARRGGEKYPPKGMYFPIRGGILDRSDVEVKTESVLALLGTLPQPKMAPKSVGKFAGPPMGVMADSKGPGPRKGDAELTKRIKSVVSYAQDFGPGAPTSSRKMADLILDRKRGQGFSSSNTLRKSLDGRYPPMKRLRLKGWKD